MKSKTMFFNVEPIRDLMQLAGVIQLFTIYVRSHVIQSLPDTAEINQCRLYLQYKTNAHSGDVLAHGMEVEGYIDCRELSCNKTFQE